MEPILLRLPAEGLSLSELKATLDEVAGGNYTVTEEEKARDFDDEELGYSPVVESFLVGLGSGVAANVLTTLLFAEIARRRKPNP